MARPPSALYDIIRASVTALVFFLGVARRVEIVMHVTQMIDSEAHVTVELGKKGVIKSLGEDTRVAHVVGSAKSNWRRTVALTRRKRMVAYILACVTLQFAVTVRRRTFFQENPSIVSRGKTWGRSLAASNFASSTSG